MDNNYNYMGLHYNHNNNDAYYHNGSYNFSF